MITSDPYASENGVSPVAFRFVVRYAHSASGSSSTQLPFAASSLFFIPFKIVRFEISASPFPCGYLGVEKLLSIQSSLQNSETRFPVNYVPLSETRILGIPKRHTIFFHIKLLTSSSSIFDKGSASIHFVK